MRLRNLSKHLFTTKTELEHTVRSSRRARKAVRNERKMTRHLKSRTGRARDAELRSLEVMLERQERGARDALRSIRF